MFRNIVKKRKLNKQLLLIIFLTLTVLIINYLVFYKKYTDVPPVGNEIADRNGNGIIDGGDILVTIPVDICEQNLENIPIEGKWESWSLDVPFWKFEFSKDKTFKYFTRVFNFTSSGKWEYDEQDSTITLFILDQFDYWKKRFFDDQEHIVKTFSGIKAMNKDNYSITFNINENRSPECTNVYKDINFLGWNFIKIK